MYAMSLRGNSTDATRGYDLDYQHRQDEYELPDQSWLWRGWLWRRLHPIQRRRSARSLEQWLDSELPKHASRRHTERAEGFDLAEG